jgi:CO/xanthine dehydrogenase Mo-binding subunit
MKYINQSVKRVDVLEKVTGGAMYPGDYDLPDQTYMKILFADRPHAVIRKIDSSEAERLEGVLAIFTAKDVPVNVYGLIVADQPVLCGPGSSQPYADHVRCVGDQIAVVVAESEEVAAEARELIVVEYDDLPILTDVREAMKPGAVLIHPGDDTNIFKHNKIRKGDVESAFERAEIIIEGTYETPVQEHAYLQPEAGMAYIDEEDRVTVVVAGQWAHEDQKQIAHALGIADDQVRVIYPAIGGAFGGREDMSVQIVLALAVWRLNQKGIKRPVKIIWSREESIIGHGKRHAYSFNSRWGATKDGKVIAAEVEMVSDGGAYIYTSTKVLGNATFAGSGAYDIPNIKIDAYAVYTNNVPGAAFRGFGAPQSTFAAEMQMNKLADALGMDQVEIRMRNILKEGALLSTNTPVLDGVSLAQVMSECAQAGGWNYQKGLWALNEEPTRSNSKPHLLLGKGIACGLKNVGFSYGFPDECWATIELFGTIEVEKAVLRHAAAEVGQGAHTALIQMAAEALDLPIEKIELVLHDTAEADNAGSVSASRMTFMAAHSIRGAAKAAMQKWNEKERPAIAKYQYIAPTTTPMADETGYCIPNYAYGYVAEVVELEVDKDTGHIHIMKVICADDVGKAVNPQQVEGQIEGAVVQAAGYSVLENFIQENGLVKTPGLSTYLIPTILDIPDEVESIIIEHPDPAGAWGIRGMGEMPFIPLPAAITAAIYDAAGVWIDDFPITPERVLKAMGNL